MIVLQALVNGIIAVIVSSIALHLIAFPIAIFIVRRPNLLKIFINNASNPINNRFYQLHSSGNDTNKGDNKRSRPNYLKYFFYSYRDLWVTPFTKWIARYCKTHYRNARRNEEGANRLINKIILKQVYRKVRKYLKCRLHGNNLPHHTNDKSLHVATLVCILWVSGIALYVVLSTERTPKDILGGIAISTSMVLYVIYQYQCHQKMLKTTMATAAKATIPNDQPSLSTNTAIAIKVRSWGIYFFGNLTVKLYHRVKRLSTKCK